METDLKIIEMDLALADARMAFEDLKKKAAVAYPAGSRVRIAHTRMRTVHTYEATVVGAGVYGGFYRPSVQVIVRNDRTGKTRTAFPGMDHLGTPEIELISRPDGEG